tara:strand:- start:14332 stop:14913 length:582 start_codon:yes stop_codon:yes gene_type:complete
MKKISKLYKIELEFLKDAINNGKNDYHTFVFSTLNDNFPKSRIVVLRNLLVDPLKIYFNADFRSPKVAELKQNSSCTALFYDKKRKVQIRFKCKSTVHYQNDYAKQAWLKTRLQSRKCYMGPFAPSKKLDEWHPNIPLEYSKSDPEKLHSEVGYINFTHIELKVVESDILQLYHNGHIRFRVDNKQNLCYLSP